jgi:hypothetical protein
LQLQPKTAESAAQLTPPIDVHSIKISDSEYEFLDLKFKAFKNLSLSLA